MRGYLREKKYVIPDCFIGFNTRKITFKNSETRLKYMCAGHSLWTCREVCDISLSSVGSEKNRWRLRLSSCYAPANILITAPSKKTDIAKTKLTGELLII